MIHKKASSVCFWERMMMTIVLTLFVIFYEASWLNNVLLPVSNIKSAEVNPE